MDEALKDAIEAVVDRRYAENPGPATLDVVLIQRLVGDRLDRQLGRTLAWLAPADAPHRRLAEEGLTESSAALRARFEERVGPTLEALDVDVSSVEAERDGWAEERGRGPGEPDADAVERARGDRNRDLFVE